MTDDEIVKAVRARLSDTGRISPQPASLEQVERAEQKIGYPLPLLLRRLYLEVANGGFGPRGGILSVSPSPQSGNCEIISDIFYGEEPNDPMHGLVQICDWGCAICSLVDVTDPSGPMWAIDNGLFFSENITFRDWIISYLDDTLEMPNADDHPECEASFQGEFDTRAQDQSSMAVMCTWPDGGLRARRTGSEWRGTAWR